MTAAEPGVPPGEPHPGCITCGDTAVALVVVEVDAARGLALCAAGGGHRETVVIDLVAPVAAGDRLLVHAGTALQALERA